MVFVVRNKPAGGTRDSQLTGRDLLEAAHNIQMYRQDQQLRARGSALPPLTATADKLCLAGAQRYEWIINEGEVNSHKCPVSDFLQAEPANRDASESLKQASQAELRNNLLT